MCMYYTCMYAVQWSWLEHVLELHITSHQRYVRIDLTTTRGWFLLLLLSHSPSSLPPSLSDIWALGCVLYELATLKHAVSQCHCVLVY